MKWVGVHFSYTGIDMPAFLPASMHFRTHAMFWAKVRMVCSPSSSFMTSSGVNPWIWFQYWDPGTTMLHMRQYWFMRWKAAESPPRLQLTTAAATFPYNLF